MPKNKLVAPVVKWVGGKRQLLDEITPLLPKRINAYCEPFLGGGAVLFSIQPSKAVVNDLNADLITVYEVIRDDAEDLIESLKKHKNTSEYFYEMRDVDRDKASYQALSKVEKASRLIYLNKTCFNGLFRVNSSGEFNSPFGHYKNPNIVKEPVLRAVSKYLNANNITFHTLWNKSASQHFCQQNIPSNMLHGIYTIPEKGITVTIFCKNPGNNASGTKAPEQKFVRTSLPFTTPYALSV